MDKITIQKRLLDNDIKLLEETTSHLKHQLRIRNNTGAVEVLIIKEQIQSKILEQANQLQNDKIKHSVKTFSDDLKEFESYKEEIRRALL